MNFFKNFFILYLLCILSFSAFAENHAKDVVEKAKEITKKLQEELDEDVPLNDPFADNQGSSNSKNSIPTDEQEDEMSLYNFKMVGLISGADNSYVSLADSDGEVITLTLGQHLGKIKLVDMRLTEAIFLKEDKKYIIIDFNNQIRETNEY